jgi:hypothetical protein
MSKSCLSTTLLLHLSNILMFVCLGYKHKDYEKNGKHILLLASLFFPNFSCAQTL